jgi:hypothetical protein
MTPKEAAEAIRPTFHLHAMPPEARHHVKFVEDVAAELGIEPTLYNVMHVANALDHAEIRGEPLHYPMMLYSRQHHAVEGVAASVYEQRHDFVWVQVENEDQAKALGDGWVESIAELPPRGEMSLHAPMAKPIEAPVEHADT